MIKNFYSEEYKDYFEEMMNIGAGNAATALEQILRRKFDMFMPSIHVVPSTKAISVLGDVSRPVTCVKMGLFGDIRGEMFFIVPSEHTTRLIEVAQHSIDRENKKGDTRDYSVIAEVGNILAGVYLTAIHDFCNLSIYHTIPVFAEDMIQSLMDETIAKISIKDATIIVIINKFLTSPEDKNPIETFLLMIPFSNSIEPLMNSFKEAKRLYGG